MDFEICLFSFSYIIPSLLRFQVGLANWNWKAVFFKSQLCSTLSFFLSKFLQFLLLRESIYCRSAVDWAFTHLILIENVIAYSSQSMKLLAGGSEGLLVYTRRNRYRTIAPLIGLFRQILGNSRSTQDLKVLISLGSTNHHWGSISL